MILITTRHCIITGQKYEFKNATSKIEEIIDSLPPPHSLPSLPSHPQKEAVSRRPLIQPVTRTGSLNSNISPAEQTCITTKQPLINF